jgi:integrase
LDFVSRSKSRDLFSDATPDRFGNRGGNATKVISRWVREKLEITDSRISPSHSFRHRFSTLCKNFGVPPEIRDRLMGHSSGDASELYGEDYSISTLCPEMEKIPVPTGLD